MKRYRITYVDLDGATQTETVPGCDPAAALGVLLDEREVDEQAPIHIGHGRGRAKLSATKRKQQTTALAATSLPAFLEAL